MGAKKVLSLSRAAAAAPILSATPKRYERINLIPKFSADIYAQYKKQVITIRTAGLRASKPQLLLSAGARLRMVGGKKGINISGHAIYNQGVMYSGFSIGSICRRRCDLLT